MKYLNIITSIIYLLILLEGSSQTNNKNYIGLSLFKFEKNSVTSNKRFEPKFFSGIEYERIGSIFNYKLGLDFGANEINDNACKNCWDFFNGRGQLKELIGTLGIKYSLFQKKTFKIKPFIGINTYVTQFSYEANFSGGIAGGSYYTNRTFQSFGCIAEAGIDYKITDNLRCSFLLSIRIDKARWGDYSNISTNIEYANKTIETASALGHFKIGYLF